MSCASCVLRWAPQGLNHGSTEDTAQHVAAASSAVTCLPPWGMAGRQHGMRGKAWCSEHLLAVYFSRLRFQPQKVAEVAGCWSSTTGYHCTPVWKCSGITVCIPVLCAPQLTERKERNGYYRRERSSDEDEDRCAVNRGGSYECSGLCLA